MVVVDALTDLNAILVDDENTKEAASCGSNDSGCPLTGPLGGYSCV